MNLWLTHGFDVTVPKNYLNANVEGTIINSTLTLKDTGKMTLGKTDLVTSCINAF